MADARNNELPLTTDTYIIMQDEDRYNDMEFSERHEAIKAMRILEDEGGEGLWVAYVDEDKNLMFEYGNPE